MLSTSLRKFYIYNTFNALSFLVGNLGKRKKKLHQ